MFLKCFIYKGNLNEDKDSVSINDHKCCLTKSKRCCGCELGYKEKKMTKETLSSLIERLVNLFEGEIF